MKYINKNQIVKKMTSAMCHVYTGALYGTVCKTTIIAILAIIAVFGAGQYTASASLADNSRFQIKTSSKTESSNTQFLVHARNSFNYNVIIDPVLLKKEPLYVQMTSWPYGKTAPSGDPAVKLEGTLGSRYAPVPVYIKNMPGAHLGDYTYNWTMSHLQVFTEREHRIVFSAWFLWDAKFDSYESLAPMPLYSTDEDSSYDGNKITMYMKNSNIFIVAGAMDCEGYDLTKSNMDISVLENWALEGKSIKNFKEDDANPYWNPKVQKSSGDWGHDSPPTLPDFKSIGASGSYNVPCCYGTPDIECLFFSSLEDIGSFRINIFDSSKSLISSRAIAGNPTDITTEFDSNYDNYIYSIEVDYNINVTKKDGSTVAQQEHDCLYLKKVGGYWKVLGASSGTWSLSLLEDYLCYTYLFGSIKHIGYSHNPNILINSAEYVNQQGSWPSCYRPYDKPEI